MRSNTFTLVVCIIGLMLSAPVYADEDCDLTLREAKAAYNAGNYTKAKKLYDYVVSICGPSYGSASSWSQKCQDALTPRLSVSRSSIPVSAYSGTTSITVTSNRTWKLANTNSSLFTVNRSGDNISISYSANPNTTSRSDYFDVVTTDGSKSVRVYINQEAKANTTPYLSVDKTSISASASGTTEYITVSSNTTWEIEYASGTMYSVTRNGNTLTVKINENTTTESRTDYFNVKTSDGNKVQKISLSQSGKSSSSTYNSSAKINKVWVDYDVYEDGKKGMRIHVNMSAYNLNSKQCRAVVYFYTESGTKLKDTNGSYRTSAGDVSCGKNFTPHYNSSSFEDFTIFMPYSELHITYKGSFKFFVNLWDQSVSPSKDLAESDWVSFTFTP